MIFNIIAQINIIAWILKELLIYYGVLNFLYTLAGGIMISSIPFYFTSNVYKHLT